MRHTTQKFKISRWMLGAVYLLIAMNLEIFKIFGDSLFLGNVNRYALITVLFSAAIAFLIVSSRVKISVYVWVITLPIILRVAIAVFSADEAGYRLYDFIQQYCGYFIILIAVPIYYVFKCEATSVREFIRVLFLLTFVSILVKSFVSIFNYFTGVIVFPATVYHDNWYRYGLLRMQPPILSNIAVPMGAFLMYSEPKRSWRRKYMIMTLLVIVFSALIHASRFTAIWQTAVFIYIIMIKRRSKAKSFIYFSVLVGLVLLLNQTGVIDSVLGTFSEKNHVMGGNTTVRLIALNFFSKQILKHPIWGNGIWLNRHTVSLHITSGGYAMGDLTDIGFFYSVVQFGLVIVIPVALLLFRLFTIGVKAHKMGYESYYILLFGSALCILFGNISIDFFVLYSISIPVMIAIVEYCNYELTKIRKSSGEGFDTIIDGGQTCNE